MTDKAESCLRRARKATAVGAVVYTHVVHGARDIVVGVPACTVAESYHSNHLGQISHGGAGGVKPPAPTRQEPRPVASALMTPATLF